MGNSHQIPTRPKLFPRNSHDTTPSVGGSGEWETLRSTGNDHVSAFDHNSSTTIDMSPVSSSDHHWRVRGADDSRRSTSGQPIRSSARDRDRTWRVHLDQSHPDRSRRSTLPMADVDRAPVRATDRHPRITSGRPWRSTSVLDHLSRWIMTVYVGDQFRPIGSKCSTLCREPDESHAHCSVCHATFRNVTCFDAHRSDGYCLDPEQVGLVEVEELWATPEGHADRARLASTRRAEAAKRRVVRGL